MLVDARVNAMLDTEIAGTTKMSLHTAYSATGTNEVTGGSYAKQTPTWNAASARSKSISANVSFSVPSGTSVRWVGLWATDGTTFKGMFPNGGTEFPFQIDLTNNRVYSEAHGLANDNKVVFTGTTLPTGVTAGTEYWVVGVTAADPDYFQVSSTQGGGAIDLTGSYPSQDARGAKLVTETFGADGTFQVTSFSVGF
jgi:hypothetical protein